MSTSNQLSDFSSTNQTVLIMAKLDQLAGQEQSSEKYFEGFVTLMTSCIGAASGYVWKPGPEGMLPIARMTSQIEESEQAFRSNLAMASRAMERPRPKIVFPNLEASPQAQTQRCCLLLPLFDDRQCFAMASFITYVDSQEKAELQLAILQAAVERVQKQLMTIRYDNALTELNASREAQKLMHGISSKLDARPLSFEVVNRVCKYLDADRVSLVFKHGEKCVMKGVSNQAVFDRRANVIRSQERLAAKVAKLNEPLWLSSEDTQERAPTLQKLIDRCFDSSNAVSMAFLPLYAEPRRRDDPEDIAATIQLDEQRNECVGVLIVEQMDRPLHQAKIESDWKRVENGIACSVANSAEHNRLFLMPLWRALGRFADLFRGHTRRKAVLITGLIASVILGLILIPADFKLRSDGQIQPIHRRHVFAETEGKIEKLLFTDGKAVQEGQPLLLLSNPELSAELAEVQGKLDEATTKLETLTMQRVTRSFDDEEEESDLVRQAATTEARMGGLRRQVALLEESVGQLKINSPMSGQVINWDSEQRLSSRPVKRGDRLLTVALPSGEWEIELRVPDKRSGYLLQKWEKLKDSDSPEMEVTFVLSSEPTKKFKGLVFEVSPNSNADEKESDNVVRARVRLTKDEFDRMGPVKPGTTVVGQVHCGRASIGYCKLYEFFDWTQRMWFKYVS